jgi:hypothetical protein
MRRSLIAASLLSALFLSGCGNNPSPPPAEPSAPAPAEPSSQPVVADDAALEPLFGTWGLDPNSCEQTLKISKTRFEGAENGCDISSFSDNGDGSFTAAMSCSSQGQTAEERIKMRPVFAPAGEGVELTYLNRDNLETLLLRCPDAPSN